MAWLEVFASLNKSQSQSKGSTSGALCFPTDSKNIVFNGKEYGEDAILQMGNYSNSGAADSAAKNADISGNSKYVILRYTVNSSNSEGIIIQSVGSTVTTQLLFLNGTTYVRRIGFTDTAKSTIDPDNTTDWTTTLFTGVSYDSETRRLNVNWLGTTDQYITLPLATPEIDGLLSKEDKPKLGSTVYLGEFDSASEGEEAAVELASHRHTTIIIYDIKNGPTCRIEQVFSNTTATIQYLYYNGSRYVRKISWNPSIVGAWKNVTGSERISGLTYDSATRTLKLKDALDDPSWGGVELPIPNPQTIGSTATSSEYLYTYKGPQVGANQTSTDQIADININTNTESINIVTKSWGTNTWVGRVALRDATSGRAGLMSASQCIEHERATSLISYLMAYTGIDSMDLLANQLLSR